MICLQNTDSLHPTVLVKGLDQLISVGGLSVGAASKIQTYLTSKSIEWNPFSIRVRLWFDLLWYKYIKCHAVLEEIKKNPKTNDINLQTFLSHPPLPQIQSKTFLTPPK